MSEIKVTDNRGKSRSGPTPMPAFDADGNRGLIGGPPTTVESKGYSITDNLESAIAQTLQETNVLGSKVGYFISPTVIPGPDGQPSPFLFVLFETKSVVLGQMIQTSGFIPFDGNAEQNVRAVIPKLLEELERINDEIRDSTITNQK